MKGQKMKTITAKELEDKFDNNEDISEYMDFSKVTKLDSFLKDNETKSEKIYLSFPENFITILDKKSKAIGVDKESFIKMIVAERLGLIGA